MQRVRTDMSAYRLVQCSRRSPWACVGGFGQVRGWLQKVACFVMLAQQVFDLPPQRLIIGALRSQPGVALGAIALLQRRQKELFDPLYLRRHDGSSVDVSAFDEPSVSQASTGPFQSLALSANC